MASPYALDFSPITNALAGARKHELALQEQAMERERLGFARAAAGREAEMFPYKKQEAELQLDAARKAAQQQAAQRALAFWEANSDAYGKLPPEQQATHWNTFLGSKFFDDNDRKMFGNIPGWNDPVVGPKLLLAYGSKYRDPLEKRALTAKAGEDEASAELKRAQAEAAKGKGVGYDNLKQYTDAAEGLRKEFNTLPVVKNYVDAQSAADRLKSLVEKAKGGAFGSGAGDIAMVFSFIKALDPTSVVQPGEQATARNAPGVTDQLLNTYNRILNGEFLTGKTRDDFMKVIESELEHRKRPAIEQARRYRTIAKETKIIPDHILPRVFGGVDLDGDGRPDAVQPPPTPTFNPPPRAQVPGGQGQIPPNAVRFLQQNPNPDVIRQFEEKYGPGSAQQFLTPR